MLAAGAEQSTWGLNDLLPQLWLSGARNCAVHDRSAETAVLHNPLNRAGRLPFRIEKRHLDYLYIRLQPDRLDGDFHLQGRAEL